MSKFIIWDQSCQYDLFLSKQLDISLFGDNEIISQFTFPEHFKTSAAKKVIFVNFVLGNLPETWPKDLDVSWVDLIVSLDCELIPEEFDTYYQTAVKIFNNKNIVFISGGSRCLQAIDSIKNRFFYPYLGFFHRVVMANHELNLSHPKTRPYLFDALLGGKKFHRLFVFDLLKKSGLIDKSIVSLTTGPYDQCYQKPNQNSNVDDYESVELALLEDPFVLAFKNNNTTVESRYSAMEVHGRFYKNCVLNPQMSVIVPEKIYENSWYSIISETNFEQFFFLTEKTAKPIFAKRIFISFSYCKHLKFLKDQGFKTFDNIIDESYDNEPDHELRFLKAWQQVEYLSTQDPIEIYKKAESVLEHNYQIMQNCTQINITKIQSFIFSHLKML